MKTRFCGHSAPICKITINDGYIHSTSNDKTLRVWHRETGECVYVVDGFKYIPTHAADSRYIYVLAWSDVFIFDVQTWEKVTQLHMDTEQDLQGVVADEQQIYITARDGKLFVIDKGCFEVIRTLETGGSAWATASSAQHLYLSSLGGSITVWDKAQLRPVQVLHGHKANVQRLAVDDRYLYSLSADRDLIVWSRTGGDLVRRIPKVFRRSMIGIAPGDQHVYLANAEEGLKILEKGTWRIAGARPDLRVPYGKGMAAEEGMLYLGLTDFSINVIPEAGLC